MCKCNQREAWGDIFSRIVSNAGDDIVVYEEPYFVLFAVVVNK